MKSTLLLLFFSSVYCFNASIYANKQVLSPTYTLYWTKDGDFMNIAMEAQTTGWVGFGIGESTSGSMPGADLVVATVVNGQTTVTDYFATEKATPPQDECNQWIKINGEEANGKTIVELRRAINTGDKQDRPFEDSNKVVVAYGRTDSFAQHIWQLAIQINFWPADNSNHRTVPTGLPSMQFVSNNYVIPPVKTTYADFYHNVSVEVDVHAVAFEPVFNPATQKYIHHFVVFASEVFANSGKSLDSSWSVLWAWAPGMAPMVFPHNVGMRFGPNGYKSIRFQIHYDNLNNDVGVVDSGSGVRIWYNTTMRQYDAGVFETGDIFVRNPTLIPQGNSRSYFEYTCPSDCSIKFPGVLNVFQVFLHMHQAGAQMWGTQWRENGTFVRETNRIDFYDFGFQQHTPANFQIFPGDRINTHCVYQQLPTGPVRFGQGSEEEMCVQYMFYYPKYNMQYCGFYQANKSLDVSNNSTMCNYTIVAKPNPDIRDPPGGEAVKFGTDNEPGFCNRSLSSTFVSSAAPVSSFSSSAPVSSSSPKESTETKETKVMTDISDTVTKETETRDRNDDVEDSSSWITRLSAVSLLLIVLV